MKEFLGIGGYTRNAEGFLSWQHLLFVGILLCVMVVLAVLLGKSNKFKSDKEKNRPLIIAALLIDGLELFKIAVLCYRGGSADAILYNLPLFLCSIQLITLPLAAFSIQKPHPTVFPVGCSCIRLLYFRFVSGLP